MGTATSTMFLAAALALAAGAAAAQNANPGPQDHPLSMPDRVPPSSGSSTEPKDGAPGTPGEDLSRSQGVITPPPTGDQGVVPPPRSGGQSMPVIPPPGTPGGNQNVQPK